MVNNIRLIILFASLSKAVASMNNLQQFDSIDNALPHNILENLSLQCNLVADWILSQDFGKTLNHNKRPTFWMPIKHKDIVPRFTIETAILQIQHLDEPWFQSNKIVGAEWWVQKTDQNGKIGFHYDKDEGEASIHSRMRHPVISTVTYLTDGGAPTMVFNMTTNGNEDFPTIPTQAYISFPKKNRHTVFW